MCTSLSWRNGGHYFGRNLDLECDFGQQVVVTPRRFPLRWRMGDGLAEHRAIIGMAAVRSDTPLYADAANEAGLCMAGLNFPGHAHYAEPADDGRAHVAPWELPLWLLSQCDTVDEALALLDRTQIVRMPFDEHTPLTPLHWHLADAVRSVVLECMADGLHVHEDPFGVLTNSPPFDFHRQNLCQYMQLSSRWPENRFAPHLPLKPAGCGLGGFGLPGDASPASRFVRGAFLLANSICAADAPACVAHFFHLLDAVAMTKGSVQTEGGRWEYTRYSCCIDASRGVYYFRTYEDPRMAAVALQPEGDALRCYPVEHAPDVRWINKTQEPPA